MTRMLNVIVNQDGQPFLAGEFEVGESEREAVLPLLPEIDLDREKAEAILSGYMHANDVGEVSDDLGKLALVAAVYMLEKGADEVVIDLETPTEPPTL